MPPNKDHVVIKAEAGLSWFACLHCGDRTELHLPIELRELGICGEIYGRRHASCPPPDHTTKTCPKCLATSGDDWAQCKGSCPMPGSPHYKIKAKP